MFQKFMKQIDSQIPLLDLTFWTLFCQNILQHLRTYNFFKRTPLLNNTYCKMASDLENFSGRCAGCKISGSQTFFSYRPQSVEDRISTLRITVSGDIDK